MFKPNISALERFHVTEIRLSAIRKLFPMVPLVTSFAELQDASKTNRAVMLSGWDLGSDDLLTRHKSEVMRRTPLSINEAMVDDILRVARTGADMTIGVHVRHGDYASYNGGLYMYSSQEYAVAMKAINASFAPKNVKFVICSDAPQKPEYFRGLDVTFAVGTSPADDITILSRCDSILGTHSTFNRWAAFIGSKPLYCLDRQTENFVSVS